MPSIQTNITRQTNGKYLASIQLARKRFKMVCWSLEQAQQWLSRKLPQVRPIADLENLPQKCLSLSE